MADFLTEFLAYFFPSISTYPEWVAILLGCFLLCFVFRVICALIHSFGGGRL